MFGGLLSAVRRPKLGLALLTLLHLASLALFINGFLLTRVHLPERSTERPGAAANATAPPPYDRVVWLMIDALRYDFVVSDGRYRCADAKLCHQGHMPFLSELSSQVGAATASSKLAVQHVVCERNLLSRSRLLRGARAADAKHCLQPPASAVPSHSSPLPLWSHCILQDAARSFMFVADAPTTTTQRLKSLATGGLPSFFDISNSFTAGAVADDNLVDQLAAAGHRLVNAGSPGS